MSKSIKNKWYERYYSNSTPLPRVSDDYSFSNMMYDNSKGISYALLPYCEDTSCTRFVGDVEICMSVDPNVTSRFSSEHRDMIKKQLASQPHSPAPVGPSPTDEQLIYNGAVRSLERDEIVAASKYNMSRLDSELPFPSSVPTPAPSSASSSASTPAPSPDPSNT